MTRIVLPWFSPDLTPHARGNWHKKARATKASRAMAYWAAKEAGVKRDPEAVLRVTYHPPNLRADVQNQHGRCKGYIDGIADAMKCDDKRFKVVFPSEFGEVRKGGQVVIEIGGKDEAS